MVYFSTFTSARGSSGTVTFARWGGCWGSLGPGTRALMHHNPRSPRGPRAPRAGGGAGSAARAGESRGVTGAAAAAAPASCPALGIRFSSSRGFFGGGEETPEAPTEPMRAAVVHRLATGGANGRRPGLRRGAGWEPREPAEAGRWRRGAERGPAWDREGGSRRRRRGRRPGALRAARGAGPWGCAIPSRTPSGVPPPPPRLPGTVTVRT